jgi:hypothetical protein
MNDPMSGRKHVELLSQLDGKLGIHEQIDRLEFREE